ncbi:MAG: hypothetical protein ILA39_06140 [Bacteroidaceae bacterium]|nr:hypothetical protein [Bacteroidaceae bacterium]
MTTMNLMIAEKATVDYLSLERIADAIDKACSALDVFAGVGGMDAVLKKVSMTQYTYAGMGGMMKAQVDDGKKCGMVEVLDFDEDEIRDFLVFRRSTSHRISLEQSAALYWSQKIPNCWLVSESQQVLDIAQGLEISTMTIEGMRQAFFAEDSTYAALTCTDPPAAVLPFDPRVDADKVEAAFSDGLDGDLSVLRQKSYWVVVCVLFEWAGWLRLRKRADFCRWVNAHFHFDNPIDAETDLKTATQRIKVKERNLELWPPNQYRDLAYLLKDIFFGERRTLSDGYYVYANEPLYLKPGKLWRRRDW